MLPRRNPDCAAYEVALFESRGCSIDRRAPVLVERRGHDPIARLLLGGAKVDPGRFVAQLEELCAGVGQMAQRRRLERGDLAAEELRPASRGRVELLRRDLFDPRRPEDQRWRLGKLILVDL